jgi:hypothetical protein
MEILVIKLKSRRKKGAGIRVARVGRKNRRSRIRVTRYCLVKEILVVRLTKGAGIRVARV